jgi:hypothetical protein
MTAKFHSSYMRDESPLQPRDSQPSRGTSSALCRRHQMPRGGSVPVPPERGRANHRSLSSSRCWRMSSELLVPQRLLTVTFPLGEYSANYRWQGCEANPPATTITSRPSVVVMSLPAPNVPRTGLHRQAGRRVGAAQTCPTAHGMLEPTARGGIAIAENIKSTSRDGLFILMQINAS